MLQRPGAVGVRCLLKDTSVVVLKEERALVIYSPTNNPCQTRDSNPFESISWRVIEADKVKPNRLQDILFTGTGKKGDNYKFGPVVANSIKIWKTVERRIGGPFKVVTVHLYGII